MFSVGVGEMVTGIPTIHVVAPRFKCVIYCRLPLAQNQAGGFWVWSFDVAEVVAVYGSRWWLLVWLG